MLHHETEISQIKNREPVKQRKCVSTLRLKIP